MLCFRGPTKRLGCSLTVADVHLDSSAGGPG